jgi:hypothetical protein
MEKSIGFLEGVSGHTYDTIYDLLFTSERVIAIIIQHPTDVPYKLGVMELFLGGQMGKHSERPERRRVAEERRRIYKEKSIDELVASHRFNFEIRYSTVTSVELTRGLFHSHLKFHTSAPSIARHTIRFTLTKDQVPKARHLIDLVLPFRFEGKS